MDRIVMRSNIGSRIAEIKRHLAVLVRCFGDLFGLIIAQFFIEHK